MDDLVQAARAAMANAYAPYSVYHVGAAVLGSDGEVYTGCNVENVSYGLTICAERVAVGNMVSQGCTQIKAVAVVTRDGGSPCGACRQVLAEFAPEPESTKVFCASENLVLREYTLAELLPSGFKTDLKQL